MGRRSRARAKRREMRLAARLKRKEMRLAARLARKDRRQDRKDWRTKAKINRRQSRIDNRHTRKMNRRDTRYKYKHARLGKRERTQALRIKNGVDFGATFQKTAVPLAGVVGSTLLGAMSIKASQKSRTGSEDQKNSGFSSILSQLESGKNMLPENLVGADTPDSNEQTSPAKKGLGDWIKKNVALVAGFGVATVAALFYFFNQQQNNGRGRRRR